MIVCFLSNNLISQNKINLLNGKKIGFTSYITDSESQLIKYQFKCKKDNDKYRYLDMNDIFSITTNNYDSIIYQPIFEEELSIENMKYYVLGKQNALEHHKSWLWAAGGFFIGTGSLILPINNLIGLAIPISYSTTAGFMKPTPEKIASQLSDIPENEYFILGYQQNAKNKNLKSAIAGSAGGLVLSAAILTTIKLLSKE